VRALVAYYTRSGTNQRIVNELQDKLSCDVEKIIDTANRKEAWGFFISGMQAALKRKTRIKSIEKDPSSYDVVVIICPIWAGVMPPPIRTYISENKERINKTAFLSVSGSGAGNKRAVPDFEFLAGKKTVASSLLTDKEFNQGNYKEKLEDFVESILAIQLSLANQPCR
jgi:flavodoxin